MNLPGNGWIMSRANNYVLRADEAKINGAPKPAGSVIFPKVGGAIHTNKKRLLGQCAYVDNNVMAVWSRDPARCSPEYLYLYFMTVSLSALSNPGPLPSINNGQVYEQIIDLPPMVEQRRIAAILWKVQRAIELEDRLVATTRELKRSAMQQMLTRGSRGEPQRETEVGPLPRSWRLERLEDCCAVVSSSMAYAELEQLKDSAGPKCIETMGIKVSDMNEPGNEREIVRANLSRCVSEAVVRRRFVPPGTVVFPKRGAAIATNKKRMTTAWTVLDPNLIGVHPGESVDPWYLFYWLERFDLRTITEAGPTPQLNKKNLVPLLFPLPETREQREIAATLAKIDASTRVHERKRECLDELFQSLLHRLVTAQIRVNELDIDTTEVALS